MHSFNTSSSCEKPTEIKIKQQAKNKRKKNIEDLLCAGSKTTSLGSQMEKTEA